LVSRITTLINEYGKFGEILPEELDSDLTQRQLEEKKIELDKIFYEDIGAIKDMVKKTKMRIRFEDFETSDPYLIRKGFLHRNERLEGTQKVKYFLAHVYMGKSALTYLATNIINEIPLIRKHYSEYHSLAVDERKKRIAFIVFNTRLSRFYRICCKHSRYNTGV
jgi:hypothetical protein